MFAEGQGKTCFMPYFPVGYPDLPTSLDIMEGLAQAGADAIEVGVPFSDPIADGPVVQMATQAALKNGVGLPQSLEAVRELRRRGVSIPLLLMSYINPLLAFDLEKLALTACEMGVSGFIVPDLPPDEAADLQTLTEKYDLAFPHFLAPTSSPKRIQLAAAQARGFIYLVSVTGVTGARADVPLDLEGFIQRVRQQTTQPLVVGFGIGSAEKAQAVGTLAEGIIIGSKLITLAQESPQAVIHFAANVRQALDS
jgi:tryptophan synthase alpha chain